MPRGPQLDAPGTLHHMMVRGIERAVIFRDDLDRVDFLTRLALLVGASALTVYAWALLPNHAHLLVRTGAHPLPRSMRSLSPTSGRRPAGPGPPTPPLAPPPSHGNRILSSTPPGPGFHLTPVLYRGTLRLHESRLG